MAANDVMHADTKETLRWLVAQRSELGLAEALGLCLANATNESGLRVCVDFRPHQIEQYARWLIEAGIFGESE